MIKKIYQSDNIGDLDRLVKTFVPNRPIVDENNVRIGSILRIWREGNKIMADLEAVPEDMENGSRIEPW